MPRHRLVDAQTHGIEWDQAHRGKFGGPDREAAHGEREQHEAEMSLASRGLRGPAIVGGGEGHVGSVAGSARCCIAIIHG